MKGEFILRPGVGQKLEFAINRNGGDARVVEWLSTGDNFKTVCLLASGEYALIPVTKAVEQIRSKIRVERYEAFPAELQAKLILENGRFYFTVVGTGLESKHWPNRLKSGGHKLSKDGEDVLSKPDYDAQHRLEAGREYKLALVFGTEFATDAERSTANVQAFARHEFGEQTVVGLKGEFTLLFREKFTNAELEIMGLWYIAVLHEPIVDSGGRPLVLGSRRNGGSFVDAGCDKPDNRWRGNGAFAFPVS